MEGSLGVATKLWIFDQVAIQADVNSCRWENLLQCCREKCFACAGRYKRSNLGIFVEHSIFDDMGVDSSRPPLSEEPVEYSAEYLWRQLVQHDALVWLRIRY